MDSNGLLIQRVVEWIKRHNVAYEWQSWIHSLIHSFIHFFNKQFFFFFFFGCAHHACGKQKFLARD